MSALHTAEILQGKRFAFGDNWASFLSTLNDARIDVARRTLQRMLEMDDLRGMTFLDIGCGSGLSSLAARSLGATVRSFDYDPRCVACAQELKRQYYPDDPAWTIAEGSVLDEGYMKSLGAFDIVYCWGVLHHTGNLNAALRNAQLPVSKGGLLFIAIYNDQGPISTIWSKIKHLYCSGIIGRCLVMATIFPLLALQSTAIGVLQYKNPLGYMAHYRRKRGMSIYHDWIDWLGGYPFEVAKPEVIFRFYREAGFQLVNMTTTNRLGCNQFVFQRLADEQHTDEQHTDEQHTDEQHTDEQHAIAYL